MLAGIFADPAHLRAWLTEADALRVDPEFVVAAYYSAGALVVLFIAFAFAPPVVFVVERAYDKVQAHRLAKLHAEEEQRRREDARARLERIIQVWWQTPEMAVRLTALSRGGDQEMSHDDDLERLERHGVIEVIADRRDPAVTWMATLGAGPALRKVCRLTADAAPIVRRLLDEVDAGATSPAGPPRSTAP